MHIVKIQEETSWVPLIGAVATEKSPGEYEVAVPISGSVKDGYYDDKLLSINGKPSTSVIQGNTQRSTVVGSLTSGMMVLHVLVDLETIGNDSSLGEDAGDKQ